METFELACQIARRWPVFFCHDDKSPTCRGGFYAATQDPIALARLWRRSPGPLIAVRTGGTVAVLDVDPAGTAWLERNHNRLPPTLTVATRRDPGRHLYFTPPPELRTSAGRIAPGIDVRARAGYAIAWAAHGYPVIDRSPIAPWPDWLSEELERRPDPAVRASDPAPKTNLSGSQPRYRPILARLLAPVSAAQMGQKRSALLKASYTLGGYLDDAGLAEADALQLLLDALPQADVLDWDAAERAAQDALRAGQDKPLALPDRPYAREAAE